MALGKNLKKQELISGEKKKKTPPKKKVEKKSLIKTKKQTSKASKKQALANYISEQEQKRKELLRKRYREEVESIADKTLQCIVFKIAGEDYAIDIAKVREVVVATELSEAPNTPTHVKGIASIRGKAFLAMDLATKFKKKSGSHFHFLLAVNAGDSAVGFVLEKLPKTLKIEGSAISSDVSSLDRASSATTYIKGLIQNQGRIIFYLDVDELILSDQAIVVPDELLK